MLENDECEECERLKEEIESLNITVDTIGDLRNTNAELRKILNAHNIVFLE